MQIQPYLFFEGRCDEAIGFYKKAIGAETVMLMRYGENPDAQNSPMQMPADKVMHAELKIGESTVLMSDGMCQGHPAFQGFSLTLNVGSDAEARRLFDALADGGEATMPLAETFYATSFGMLADRFGVGWIVITPKPMP